MVVAGGWWQFANDQLTEQPVQLMLQWTEAVGNHPQRQFQHPNQASS